MIKVLTKEMLDHIFKEIDEDRVAANGYEPGQYNEFEFLTSEVFELVTYDSEVDTKWGMAIYEVLCAIRDRKTWEFFNQGDVHYNVFLLVCQLLDQRNWIEWGTSIRGCWFYADEERSAPMGSLGICNLSFDDPCYDNEGIEFTEENINTLLEWIVERTKEE